MKGVIYHGVHDIKVENIEEPKAGDNDVVVKVVENGICGSDLHAYNLGGDDIGITAGGALGHEFVGTIKEVGNNVAGINIGDRVFVNPVRAKGTSAMLAMAGGLSEYDLVKDAKLNYNIFKLPDNVSFDRAVVTEPYSVGIHAKNLANPKIGQKFIILGAGPVGLAAASGLLMQGIKDVAVIDISENRLKLAAKLGATAINAASLSADDLKQKLVDLFGTGHGLMGDERVGADTWIDCVGLPAYMEDFIEWAKMDAKFIIVALGAKPVSFKPQFLAMNELSFIGSAVYDSKDNLEAIKNLSDPNNVFPEIVSVHYPLDKAEDAFKAANEDKSLIKVIIDVNKQ